MNIKNPAIKRIMADVRELDRHPSTRFSAAPLEDNMFEWHFTIRGPSGSDFEGGIYHGRILLPAEYPFKPPNIVFLTKNGRFEVGTKICLSISAYHEESWQPAWGVRTMLEAIISFLPSEGAGAIGALDWTKDERQRLAKESHSFCCALCGLTKSLLTEPADDTDDAPDGEIAAQISQLRMQGKAGPPSGPSSPRSVPGTPARDDESEPAALQGAATGRTEHSDSFGSTADNRALELPTSPRSSVGTGTNTGNSTPAEAVAAATRTSTSFAVPETPPLVRDVRRRILGQRAAEIGGAVDGLDNRVGGGHAAGGGGAAGARRGETVEGIDQDLQHQVAADDEARDMVDDLLVVAMTLLGLIISLLLIRKIGRSSSWFNFQDEL